MATFPPFRTIATPTLDIAYEDAGPPEGTPIVLMHGFPYDVRAYDAVTPILNAAGFRTIAPYLRGFGPTRFRDPETVRSGEQAAVANDLLALVDALGLDRPILAGFDWGGRAAGAAAALWPERFRGLLAMEGYLVYDVASGLDPLPPEIEHVLWYQYYLHGERGRRGLEQNRRAFCRLLWSLWSPRWQFDEETYARTAGSFDNPDFVAVVLHSYRHRFGLAPSDPALVSLEQRLATAPPVTIPTVVLSAGSGMMPQVRPIDEQKLPALLWSAIVDHAGHNMPQETPDIVAETLLLLAARI